MHDTLVAKTRKIRGVESLYQHATLFREGAAEVADAARVAACAASARQDVGRIGTLLTTLTWEIGSGTYEVREGLRRRRPAT